MDGTATSSQEPRTGLAASLPEPWRAPLEAVLDRHALARLDAFLAAEEAAGARVFPAPADRFRALALTPPERVRVVILGQDPYHGEGQAHGLSFSVRPGVRPPPSLVNIFKELEADLGLPRPRHGFLEHWARQGVLLLNTVLTVRMGEAASHRERGWEHVTDAVIRAVAARSRPAVFLLWGAHAQKKAPLIAEAKAGAAAADRRHLVLTAAHPSPLSARNGFFGCRHFSTANAFLASHALPPIDWSLPDA